jgi:hypothetical protein
MILCPETAAEADVAQPTIQGHRISRGIILISGRRTSRATRSLWQGQVPDNQRCLNHCPWVPFETKIGVQIP